MPRAFSRGDGAAHLLRMTIVCATFAGMLALGVAVVPREPASPRWPPAAPSADGPARGAGDR